jgi:hypothetical protein
VEDSGSTNDSDSEHHEADASPSDRRLKFVEMLIASTTGSNHSPSQPHDTTHRQSSETKSPSDEQVYNQNSSQNPYQCSPDNSPSSNHHEESDGEYQCSPDNSPSSNHHEEYDGEYQCSPDNSPSSNQHEESDGEHTSHNPYQYSPGNSPNQLEESSSQRIPSDAAQGPNIPEDWLEGFERRELLGYGRFSEVTHISVFTRLFQRITNTMSCCFYFIIGISSSGYGLY